MYPTIPDYLSSVKSPSPPISVYQILVQMENELAELSQNPDHRVFASYKTALSRQKPSEPIQKAATHFDFRGKIGLDFGCGKSVDADFLQSLGATCYRYDPFYAPLCDIAVKGITSSIPFCKFDFICAIFVLNVLPTADQQIIAHALFDLVRPGGWLILGLREDISEVKNTWISYDCGWITPKNTFQTFFPVKESFTIDRIAHLFPNFNIHYLGRSSWILCGKS